jgi:hypothetical protein
MGATLEFNWPNTESLLQSMVDVGLQANELDDYFHEHVLNTKGLDYDLCALKPIGDQLPKLGDAFTWTRKHYQKRWLEVIQALAVTAEEHDKLDKGVNLHFDRYTGDLDKIVKIPDMELNVKIFTAEDLTLDAPEAGKAKLKHDSKWTKTTQTWDSTRDWINDAIDTINNLGVSLPKLSTKSLDEFIIYPLSGNYELLRTNANACGNLDSGFTDWSDNFARLAGKTTVTMGTSSTATNFSAHLLLYSAVMRAVGKGVGKGSVIFDQIATMSETIAVRVEKALIKCVEKLAKLVAKLSSKLSWFGWVIFAKDVVNRGMAAVTDIYDDIQDCITIIDTCLELSETIKAWAQTVADNLAKIEKIKDMVRKLPKVNTGGGAGGIPTIKLPEIKKDLGEIDIEFQADTDEEKELKDALEDLEDSSD